MVDELDQTSDRIDFDTSVAVKNVCEKASKFEKGEEGDCDLCGEFFSRVVLVEKSDKMVRACGRCRDRHGIK